MAREETVQRLVGDRYTLLEPLGRGGMGTVWRATDELLQRRVAVKQVTIPALDPSEQGSVRERVIREARAAARLGHRASVTVFDVVEDAGSVHIVMELLEADTLAELVARRGPLTVEEAARLGLELVGALDAAHRQGIVHRDVKPSNVMMLPTGAVKLTDFGIASVKDHPSVTGTGQVLGSPSYMAPEQAMSSATGEAVDWWGLGATLYFALEGRPPFDRGGAVSTLTAVVHDEPASPVRAGAMAPVLERLLEKEPLARPGPTELRSLLHPLAGSERPGTPAPPPAPAPRVDAGEPPAPPPAPAPPPTRTPAERRPPPPPTGTVAEARPHGSPARPAGGPARRRPAVVLALLAVVAVLLGALAWASSTGDEGERRSPAEGARVEERPTAGGNGDGAKATGTGGVPTDWVTYTDPKVGYRVAHPPGWRVRTLDRTRTDIADPSTGAYLRLDWTDRPGPSPEGAWEAQSRSFGSRHDGYDEIRIEPTTYKGFDAAVWEYAYSAGGARLHAVNLGFVTGRYGFALNFQTSEGRWSGSQSTFDAFKASFRPPD